MKASCSASRPGWPLNPINPNTPVHGCTTMASRGKSRDEPDGRKARGPVTVDQMTDGRDMSGLTRTAPAASRARDGGGGPAPRAYS